jgi:hypothetical protein
MHSKTQFRIFSRNRILNFMTNDDSIEDQPDDLDDLIRWLEEEKTRLRKCVEEAAEQWEFSEAKAFAKAHSHIVGRLQALKNLRHPDFDERAGLYRKLVALEEQIKTHADIPEMVRQLTVQLKLTNQALDKLEKVKHSPLDTQYIDDAIFQLVDGNIESFKLHLNKGERIIFDFVCRNRRLQIEVSYRKRALFQFMKRRLREIGFSKIHGRRKFVYAIDVSKFKDAQKIKQLLAVVLFDVFGRSWFDNPAELEIQYKSRPSSENNDRRGEK